MAEKGQVARRRLPRGPRVYLRVPTPRDRAEFVALSLASASFYRGLASPLIHEVRGLGLMIGIELTADFAQRAKIPEGKAPSLWLVERLHEAGLLTIPSGTHAIRWLPALNVTRAEIDEAAAILARVLAAL